MNQTTTPALIDTPTITSPTNDSPMHIGIVGAGAIGCSLAAILQDSFGNNARLRAIDSRPNAKDKQVTVTLTLPRKNTQKTLDIRLPIAQKNEKMAYIFVTTKATDLTPTLSTTLLTHADHNTVVIGLANGMKALNTHHPLHNLQPINHLIDQLKLHHMTGIPGFASFPAKRLTNEAGETLIQATLVEPSITLRQDPKLTRLAEPIRNRHYAIKLSNHDDFKRASFEKLGVNLSNLMAAALGLNCQEILEDPLLKQGIMTLLGELHRYYDKVTTESKNKNTFIQDIIQAMENVGPHPTSTGMDVMAGNPTEKDTLFAALLEDGFLNHLHSPITTLLFQLLEDRENQCCAAKQSIKQGQLKTTLDNTAKHNQQAFKKAFSNYLQIQKQIHQHFMQKQVPLIASGISTYGVILASMAMNQSTALGWAAVSVPLLHYSLECAVRTQTSRTLDPAHDSIQAMLTPLAGIIKRTVHDTPDETVQYPELTPEIRNQYLMGSLRKYASVAALTPVLVNSLPPGANYTLIYAGTLFATGFSTLEEISPILKAAFKSLTNTANDRNTQGLNTLPTSISHQHSKAVIQAGIMLCLSSALTGVALGIAGHHEVGRRLTATTSGALFALFPIAGLLRSLSQRGEKIFQQDFNVGVNTGADIDVDPEQALAPSLKKAEQAASVSSLSKGERLMVALKSLRLFDGPYAAFFKMYTVTSTLLGQPITISDTDTNINKSLSLSTLGIILVLELMLELVLYSQRVSMFNEHRRGLPAG